MGKNFYSFHALSRKLSSYFRTEYSERVVKRKRRMLALQQIFPAFFLVYQPSGNDPKRACNKRDTHSGIHMHARGERFALVLLNIEAKASLQNCNCEFYSMP